MNETGPYDKSELFDLLHQLDDELGKSEYRGRLKLDVVGGFAMLLHSLRHNDPHTSDIDVCVPSFDDTVTDALETVSADNGISPYWLNNHTVLPFDATDDVATQDDVDVANAVMFAEYQPVDLGFRHIDLNVATIPTLVYGKALAASDVFADRATTDIDDLMEIFEQEGVYSIDDAKRAFPHLKDPEFENFANVYRLARDAQADAQDYVQGVAELAAKELAFDDLYQTLDAIDELDDLYNVGIGSNLDIFDDYEGVGIDDLAYDFDTYY